MTDTDHPQATRSARPYPLPARLRAVRLRLGLEVQELLELPPHKGGLLRGLLGLAIKRLACAQREPTACPPCALGNACPYGYLFETMPAPGLSVAGDSADLPSPFVVEPPEDQRIIYRPGERLELGLVLIGRGMQYLPYMLLAWEELGRQGIGRRRARFAVHPAVEDLRGAAAPLALDRGLGAGFGPAELAARAAAWPADRLTLHYRTPTRIKHQQQYLSRPEFPALIAALARRVAALALAHADEPWALDGAALAAAADVRIAAARTTWAARDRYAPRQQQGQSLSGLVGTVSYAGDLAPFAPLLALGELIHVGKAAVFGNGRYAVEAQGDEEDTVTR